MYWRIAIGVVFLALNSMLMEDGYIWKITNEAKRLWDGSEARPSTPSTEEQKIVEEKLKVKVDPSHIDRMEQEQNIRGMWKDQKTVAFFKKKNTIEDLYVAFGVCCMIAFMYDLWLPRKIYKLIMSSQGRQSESKNVNSSPKGGHGGHGGAADDGDAGKNVNRVMFSGEPEKRARLRGLAHVKEPREISDMNVTRRNMANLREITDRLRTEKNTLSSGNIVSEGQSTGKISSGSRESRKSYNFALGEKKITEPMTGAEIAKGQIVNEKGATERTVDGRQVSAAAHTEDRGLLRPR